MTSPSALERGQAISVVMPAHNAPHYLRLSLPPLARMLKVGDIAELIVIDDCSKDDTALVAASFGARVLQTPHNMGPGGARNLAVKEAKGDIVWLVDADVVVRPASVDLITRALADPGVAAVFGSYDDQPPARNFSSQYKNLIHRFYHQKSPREVSTFWAGCGAVRRDVYLKAGGFDVARFKKPSIEDIELGYRMRDAGWRIVLEPALQATHLKKWTLGGVVHTDIFCRALPWSRLLAERGKVGDELNISSVERLRALLAGFFFLSFPLALFVPGFLLAPLAATLAVIAANIGMVRFMAKIRGLPFALASLAFHQVYYVYSASVFVFCALEHRFWGAGKRRAGAAVIANGRAN